MRETSFSLVSIITFKKNTKNYILEESQGYGLFFSDEKSIKYFALAMIYWYCFKG